MDLRLLFASLDDPAPYLKDGLPISKVQSAPRPGSVDPGKPPKPTHLADDGASPNDLKRQRWAVIVPEQGGDALFDRIAPLVAQRQNEQSAETLGDAPGKPFKVPPRMSFEQASQWIQETLNPLPDEQRPRYLLMLGDPDQVSIELQQALSVYYFAGRLAFDKPDGYSEYAAKAVDFSRPESWSLDPRALSYTVRTESGQDAPDDGFEKLMIPIIDNSMNPDNRCPIPFKDVSPEPGQASAQQLLQLARDTHPTVLMSLSHGIGRSRNRPWGEEELRRYQGMMHFGSQRDPLRAEDVAKGDFLPGGMWFYFACFGAGTPSTSAYWHWLQSVSPNLDVLGALPKNGSSFIAALPQAALANRRGPLAVMGHLDLAWSYSYDQKLSRRSGQAQRFMRLTRLAERDEHPRRIGQVFLSLMTDLPQVQDDLANQYDNEARALASRAANPINPRARANMWMLRQDLRAYILLGDPAAFLPVAQKPKPVQGPLDPYLSLGLVSPALSAPASAPSHLDLDARVEAVLSVIRSAKHPWDIAREFGIGVQEVQRWVDDYQSAGREALARQLGKG